MANEPNQYVQRAQQFNRPRRTGNVNSKKNNTDFNKGLNGGQDGYIPTQPAADKINNLLQEPQAQGAAVPASSSMQTQPTRALPIGENEVRKGMEILRKYKQGKQNLEDKITRKEKWWKMAVTNTAMAGFFSSDRTIREYNDLIWHLDPLNHKK